MWSNGLTAYPTGAEVGAPVVASYRAIYKLPNGKVVAIAPLEVADLHDHVSQHRYKRPLAGLDQRDPPAIDATVGAPGFEPGTSATQRPRATRLRHTPTGPV